MEGQGSPSCVMTPAYLVCEPHRRVQYSWRCPRAHIGGLDPLSGVQQARHVVVDGLVNSLPLLKRLHVLVHELKVLCLGAQRSDVQRLAAIAVLCMVVVEADDGGHVADQRVAVRVATCMSSGFSRILQAEQDARCDDGYDSCRDICRWRQRPQSRSIKRATTHSPPEGGLGLPPKMPVMRRMKVDLPQPAIGCQKQGKVQHQWSHYPNIAHQSRQPGR